MGLSDTPSNQNASPEPSHLDDLAAYALDAVDPDEASVIAMLLATDPAAAAIESHLRDAAGAFGGAAIDIDLDAPLDLRHRILAAAHQHRSPSPIDPESAVNVHRIELERAVMLLRRLNQDQWALPVDPAELAGWTTHELAAHLASNEGLFAQSLDGAGARQPETVCDNIERTAEVLARHRLLSPSETVDELEALAASVDAAVRDLPAADLEREVPWWDLDMRIVSLLIVRSFETWTHCDDIRRACGLAQLPPPAPSLLAMSATAVTWSGIMLLTSTGNDYSGQSIELQLTGLGGGNYHVTLGFEDVDLTGIAPDAVIRCDVVDFCRALGDRIPGTGINYEATGDIDLARELVNAFNVLATI